MLFKISIFYNLKYSLLLPLYNRQNYMDIIIEIPDFSNPALIGGEKLDLQ